MDEKQWHEGFHPGEQQLLTLELQSNQMNTSKNDNSSATGGPTNSKDSNCDDVDSVFDAVLTEIKELREAQGQLEQSFDNLRTSYEKECSVILETLHEKQFRCEQLEEHLTGLTQVYQNEFLNLKEELTRVKEMDYSQERTDFRGVLEVYQKRLLKMELQQQQVVLMEQHENALTRTVLCKVISMLLAITGFLLVLVSTLAHYVILLKPSGHMLFSLLFVALLFFIWEYWGIFSKYHNFFYILSTS